MPTRPSEPPTARRRAGSAVLLAAVLVLGGCSSGPADLGAAEGPPAPETTASPSSEAVAPPALGAGADGPPPAPDPVSVGTAPPVVTTGLRDALAGRAAAVTGGDEAGFLAGVATEDRSFRDAQQVWFTNLRQLPLQVYELVPDPATLVRAGPGSYWVNVRVTLQLQGFDTAPVTSIDRYLFRAGERRGRLRLASTSDPQWEARNGVQAPPWETGPIVVRAVPGVLGLFDAASEPASAALLGSLQEGIGAVSSVVPYPWASSVVVTALSDDTFLRTLPDLPGPDPDAVAYSVRSNAAASAGPPTTTVGTRLAVHPRLLRRDGPGRARLLRHEMTHVALGERDDHAPLWLSEGLAELVSVQAEPVGRRRIQPAALDAARAGLVRLPDQTGFHDRDVAQHYGVSWWACEYVAATAGAPALWVLLEQLETLGAQSPLGVADADQQDALLISLVGVNGRTLARKAGKLIVAASEPPPAPELAPASTSGNIVAG